MNTNIGLLILRVVTGIMMLVAHGWPKLSNFSNIANSFADPIGLGPTVSLILAIFAEFFCSLAVIVGIKTRIAVIPLIVTMLVAVVIVHGDDPWSKKEFGILYLVPFVTLLFTGSGKFSIDAFLKKS